MCILFFDFQPFPQSSPYKLILASNRDEFYDRPTDTARFWDDNPNICAGRDRHPLRGGGTWLGMAKTGRIAALTNVRISNADFKLNATGRGQLVVDYVSGNDGTTEDYISGLSATVDSYNEYNLLMGDFGGVDPKMVYFTNQNGGETVSVSPGIHGLSNAKLNFPWKKLVYGKERFTDIVTAPHVSKQQLTEQLFDLMSDKTCCYPDPNLPDTQWSLSWMKGLSSICVNIPDYGTRTQTVILIDGGNHVTYTERTVVDPGTRHHHMTTESLEFDLCTQS